MWQWQVSQLVGGGFGVVNTLLQWAAVVWMGMWLGLKTERPAGAAALTFVLVVVLPSIVISVASLIVFGLMGVISGWFVNGMNLWLPAVVSGLASSAVNVGFIAWARSQLGKHFRTAASGTLPKRRVRQRKTNNTAAPPPLPA